MNTQFNYNGAINRTNTNHQNCLFISIIGHSVLHYEKKKNKRKRLAAAMKLQGSGDIAPYEKV
jgi:hypothetical protein